MYASNSPLLAVAIAALSILTRRCSPPRRPPTFPRIPTQRSADGDRALGIASEENVSPNDGRSSVPNAKDEGVIPDAADKADQKAATETQEQNLQKDVNSGAKRSGENEADAILDESKKDFKVSKRGLAAA